ncbi:MAG: hypothetical protein AAB389_01045 [Patescibacteria group bacterium]
MVAALAVVAIIWRRRQSASPSVVPTAAPAVGGQAVSAGPQPPKVSVKHRNLAWLNVSCQCLLVALIFGVPAALIMSVGSLSRVHQLNHLILAAGWFFPCWAKISSFKGGVIAFLGKTWRDRGEGPIWIFRPFFIPFEAVVRDGLLDRGSLAFEMDAETSGEDSVPYAGRMNYSKRAESQRNFHRMSEKERESGLKDWMKHFMSIEVRKFTKRKDATSDAAIQSLGDAVREGLRGVWIGGMRLEDYFGITIDGVIITDPGQPQALKDAETRREAAEQDAKAKDVIHKNLMKRARAYQTESLKNGGQLMPMEKAIEMVQINDGIVPKKVHHIDFGKNSTGAVAGAVEKVSNVIEKLFS